MPQPPEQKSFLSSVGDWFKGLMNALGGVFKALFGMKDSNDAAGNSAAGAEAQYNYHDSYQPQPTVEAYPGVVGYEFSYGSGAKSNYLCDEQGRIITHNGDSVYNQDQLKDIIGANQYNMIKNKGDNFAKGDNFGYIGDPNDPNTFALSVEDNLRKSPLRDYVGIGFGAKLADALKDDSNKYKDRTELVKQALLDADPILKASMKNTSYLTTRMRQDKYIDLDRLIAITMIPADHEERNIYSLMERTRDSGVIPATEVAKYSEDFNAKVEERLKQSDSGMPENGFVPAGTPQPKKPADQRNPAQPSSGNRPTGMS